MTEGITLNLFQKTESVPNRSYDGKVIDIHGLCVCFLQLMSQNSQLGKTISHGQELPVYNKILALQCLQLWCD